MDQHSIKEKTFISFISLIFLCLLMTCFSSSIAIFNKAYAEEPLQVAQSGETEEEDEEDDEDC